jgi:hypothetical protein
MKKSEALHILGLSEGATEDDIKQAHRKQVLAHHPDRFARYPEKKKKAEEDTKLINEARDVLLSHRWDPEYSSTGSQPYGNPYANPYTNPYTSARPSSGGAQQHSAGQGQQGQDPFGGWPFDFDYIWTSWDNPNAGKQQGQQGEQPFNPFDPFAGAQTQQPPKTPHEQYAEAKRTLSAQTILLAGKLGAVAVCAALGMLPLGLFLYVLVTVAYAFTAEFQGCSGFFILPLIIIMGPLVLGSMPVNASSIGLGLIIFTGIAVAYDIGSLRKAANLYKATKARANA